MAPLLLPPFWLLPFRLSRAPLTGSRRLPLPPRRRPRRPGRVAAAFAVEALVQGQRVAAAGLPRRMDAGHRGEASGAGPSRGGRVQRLHRVGAAALPFSTATAPDAGTRVQAHPREVLPFQRPLRGLHGEKGPQVSSLVSGVPRSVQAPVPLLLALVLLLVAALVAPEQPQDQEAICQRHNGSLACRIW